MARLVLKFGGTSLGDPEALKHAAELVAQETRQNHQVILVVSAMAGETDRLIQLTQKVAASPEKAEYDVVLSTGEQVSTGLMTIALNTLGLKARSWMSWQLPLLTDGYHQRAHIHSLQTQVLEETLHAGYVAVVPGFQGITQTQRLTTLDRGGSDITAVALAAATKAERCDIYTDVPGVLTADPNIVPQARLIKNMAYEPLLELANMGAKVLQPRAVELAMKQRVKLRILSTFQPEGPGTVVQDKEMLKQASTMTPLGSAQPNQKSGHKASSALEAGQLNGIVLEQSQSYVHLEAQSAPCKLSQITGLLHQARIAWDMLITEPGKGRICFACSQEDLGRLKALLEGHKKELNLKNVSFDENLVKISIVGYGLKSRGDFAQVLFSTLAEKDLPITASNLAEMKFSVLIPQDYGELAVRLLHTAYGLNSADESTGKI